MPYDCSDYSDTHLGAGEHNITLITSANNTFKYNFPESVSLFSLWVDPSMATIAVGNDTSLSDSNINTAWVRVVDISSNPSHFVWKRTKDCYRCNNTLLSQVEARPTLYAMIGTNYETEASVGSW